MANPRICHAKPANAQTTSASPIIQSSIPREAHAVIATVMHRPTAATYSPAKERRCAFTRCENRRYKIKTRSTQRMVTPSHANGDALRPRSVVPSAMRPVTNSATRYRPMIMTNHRKLTPIHIETLVRLVAIMGSSSDLFSLSPQKYRRNTDACILDWQMYRRRLLSDTHWSSHSPSRSL